MLGFQEPWGFWSGPNTLGTGVGAYDPAATALFARFTTPPTTARKLLISNVIASLKAGGVWSKLDGFYLTAAADSQAARQNWVQDLYNLTAINSPAFVADRGYTGDGASSYLDSGFDPTTAAGLYAKDSAHMGTFQRTAGNGAGVAMGNANARLNPSGSTGPAFLQTRANDGTTTNGTSGTLPAYGAWSRAASGSYTAYEGSTDTSTIVSVASTALTAASFTICRANGLTLNSSQIAAAHFGGALTGAQLKSARDAITTYLQAVGAA